MRTPFNPLLHYMLHIRNFALFVMGVLDSSLLILLFDNDSVAVGPAAQHRNSLS